MKTAPIAIFHGLGDCINATTYLRPIKTKYPNCSIIWITYEGYRGIVEHNPYVDRIISFDDKGAKAGFACDRRYPALRRQFPGLIKPASYISGIKGDGSLLGSFKWKIRNMGLDPNPYEPLMFITSQEKEDAKLWLAKKNLTKFVMLETSYGSSQSSWGKTHTERVIKLLGQKGYSVLLTQRQEPALEQYRELADVQVMDVHYRYAPPIYNMSQGFIGVSSGISCVVHTHQCRKDLPHLEFVRGAHWSTSHFPKQRKKIFHHFDGVVRIVRETF